MTADRDRLEETLFLIGMQLRFIEYTALTHNWKTGEERPTFEKFVLSHNLSVIYRQ